MNEFARVDCPICLEPFSSDSPARLPLLLSCAHSLCANCVNLIPKGPGYLDCPECRLRTPFNGNPKELKPNFALVTLLTRLNAEQAAAEEIRRRQPVEQAEPKALRPISPSQPGSAERCWLCGKPGTMLCETCPADVQVFCTDCCQNEHNNRVGQRHVRGPLLSKSRPQILCEEHKERVIAFCTDCQVGVCGSCVVRAHRSHRTLPLDGAAAECSDNLKRATATAMRASNRLAELIQSDSKLLEDIGLQTDGLCHSIAAEINEAMAALQRHRDELTRSVLEESNAVAQALQIRRKNLAICQSEVSAAIEEANRLVQQFSAPPSSPAAIRSPSLSRPPSSSLARVASPVTSIQSLATTGRILSALSAASDQADDWDPCTVPAACTVEFNSTVRNALRDIASFGWVVPRPPVPTSSQPLSMMRAQQLEQHKQFSRAAELYGRLAPLQVEAQVKLGLCHLLGRGLRHDFKAAAELFQRAAQQGSADGEFWLGYCCNQALGVREDFVQRDVLWRSAATRGHKGALARCLAFGVGRPTDLPRAVTLLTELAQQGDPAAQATLGHWLQTGRGMAPDLVKAVEWFQRAAEQGECSALCSLGALYLTGRGLAKDTARALQCFQQAMERGDPMGAYNIAYCCEKGVGVAVNLPEAQRLYQTAIDQGGLACAAEALNRLQQLRRG